MPVPKGMTRHPRGVVCDRARSWAALAPNGELSELERRLLDAHLVRCGACRHFSVQVAALAEELRRAPLEPLPHPVSLPRRWRHPAYGRLRTIGAAAAVAVMAVGIAARAPISSDSEAIRFPRVVDFSGGDQAEMQRLRSLRREAIAVAEAVKNRPAKQLDNRPA